MCADQVVVDCRALVRVYGSASEETQALRGVDLALRREEVAVVMGPSGSGKSTLLGLLAARDRPSAGWIDVLGTDVGSASRKALRMLRSRHVSLVPQRASIGLFPTLDVRGHLDQVASWRRVPAETEVLVERLDLRACAARRPAGLSGGEQQRLAVAMAVVGTPSIVVADEPTAELDRAHAEAVLELLDELAGRGCAVVISSHDPQVVRHGDRVMRLRFGVLADETRSTGQTLTSVDSSGRVQLPPEAWELFPEHRAELRVEGGRVVLSPPGAGR